MPSTLTSPPHEGKSPSESVSVWPIILHFRPGVNLADREQFFTFCQDNATWQIERSSQGDLVVKMPTGGLSSHRNSEIIAQLVIWARQDGTGRVFDSSGGFEFSSTAMRSPDAAWVTKTRLDTLTTDEKHKFIPLAPNFVIELRSDTDSRKTLQDKMVAYIRDGVRLGILIDPVQRSVSVYRPKTPILLLKNPITVDCSPELPGFTLDISAIFDADL
jgi:Uma2 family endonuclease